MAELRAGLTAGILQDVHRLAPTIRGMQNQEWQLTPDALVSPDAAPDGCFGARAAGPITGPESPQSDRSPDHRFSIQRRRPRADTGHSSLNGDLTQGTIRDASPPDAGSSLSE